MRSVAVLTNKRSLLDRRTDLIKDKFLEHLVRIRSVVDLNSWCLLEDLSRRRLDRYGW